MDFSSHLTFQALPLMWYWGLPWPWSYGNWIYNYLCNQCLSPLTLWVWIQLRWGVLDTTLYHKYCLSVTCDRLVVSLGTSASSTNKTDRHDISQILLKVALSTINIPTLCRKIWHKKIYNMVGLIEQELSYILYLPTFQVFKIW